MKEEKFPHAREPLHWWGQGGGWGEALEPWKREQKWVQRAEQRESHTEDWCQPALTNLRCLSAHPLGRFGAGS